MFLEQIPASNSNRGWVEVICGSMFSGKTEELIRRLKRVQYAQLPVKIFKPEVDQRYDEAKVVSHDENEIESTPVEKSSEIIDQLGKAKVIGIDEAQFFDQELVNEAAKIAARGIRVIITGLDMDYLGNPFGPVPGLLATAEYVTKVHAICVNCGQLAQHSHRVAANDELVHLGAKDEYEPLCRFCFNKVKKT